MAVYLAGDVASMTTIGRHDFCLVLEQSRAEGDRRSAEQWARVVFEGAPTPVRIFLTLGWRLVLGLRLVPRHEDSHVLGWSITEERAAKLVLELDSWLMHAANVIQVDGGHVTWTTYVHYRNRLAPVVWVIVLPIHRLTISMLLKRAATKWSEPGRSVPRSR